MTAPIHPATTPDLLYSEAEEDLRSAVRALLADRSDAPSVIARSESDTPYDQELWKTLAAGIGAAGLLVPEKLGGLGATHREAAVVLEELGRAATPSPYLTSAVVATAVLLALDPEDGPAAVLLGDLAAGRRTAALAVPFAAAPGGDHTAEVTADCGALTGTVRGVADAALADVLLVPAPTGLYAVERAPHREATVVLERLVPLDLTRPLASVTLDGAPATLLAGPGDCVAAVRQGLLTGAGLLASEQLGVAEWCLTETVRYTRERHQFNRPIGSFQALKHRMAEIWLQVVSARAAARNAADALATSAPDAALAVAVAQAYCSGVAVHAAEECVQLHAGIGMTWEHPAHLYLKRAKADSLAYGTAGRHRETVAGLVELPAP
ncbi:acyl-CoA/acyl-ACP dehydrogenase [Streptomyces sp. NBC_01218]|uniref:acyl-CoA dehydrogenase family protein n=1 Tax=Streptomyces sp. NBC_01218 TaxID=2903780 RepID=UPI002E11E31A|nr:acyl-CoA/acyl-ACP dehydrogenase [Streptomyces sp. NBC_01218]